MLMTAEDTRRAHPMIDADRKRKIARTAEKLRRMWPPDRLVREPAKRRKGSGSKGGGASTVPPSQSAPPAAVEPGAGTTSAATVPVDSHSGTGPGLTTSEPARAGQEPAATTRRGGPREGEYIDTQRTIVWLRASGHRVRWLAKQLGVSHAHMRSVLIGLSKLSYARCRRLEAMMALGEGGAVS